MERASYLELVESDQLALLYIQASQRSCLALQRAARRIRRNVRRSDIVLLLETNCIIVLPSTPSEGAQAVARRMYSLLADVEFELQIMYDSAAFALVQRLQNEQPLTVVEEESETVQPPMRAVSRRTDQNRLPYLAFLASYPSRRLLHLFPYELACRHHCVPVGAERGVLTLATCKQLDQELIAYFQEITQHTIFQVCCEAGMIEDILKYWSTVYAKEEKSASQYVRR